MWKSYGRQLFRISSGVKVTRRHSVSVRPGRRQPDEVFIVGWVGFALHPDNIDRRSREIIEIE
jgi:hypothetical protein